jgi:hypothetical protein
MRSESLCAPRRAPAAARRRPPPPAAARRPPPPASPLTRRRAAALKEAHALKDADTAFFAPPRGLAGGVPVAAAERRVDAEEEAILRGLVRAADLAATPQEVTLAATPGLAAALAPFLGAQSAAPAANGEAQYGMVVRLAADHTEVFSWGAATAVHAAVAAQLAVIAGGETVGPTALLARLDAALARHDVAARVGAELAAAPTPALALAALRWVVGDLHARLLGEATAAGTVDRAAVLRGAPARAARLVALRARARARALYLAGEAAPNLLDADGGAPLPRRRGGCRRSQLPLPLRLTALQSRARARPRRRRRGLVARRGACTRGGRRGAAPAAGLLFGRSSTCAA